MEMRRQVRLLQIRHDLLRCASSAKARLSIFTRRVLRKQLRDVFSVEDVQRAHHVSDWEADCLLRNLSKAGLLCRASPSKSHPESNMRYSWA